MHELLTSDITQNTYGLLGVSAFSRRLSVFAESTQDLHIMNPPAPNYVDDDTLFVECAEFCRQAVRCEPDCMERLWLEGYEVRTELGSDLISIRSAFLSAGAVREAYTRAATDCFVSMPVVDGDFSPDGRKRTFDLAQDLLRICWQGHALYTLGYLPVRVDDPQRFLAFAQRVSDGQVDSARDVLAQYSARFAAPSPLPANPDVAAIDRWLRFVRIKHL